MKANRFHTGRGRDRRAFKEGKLNGETAEPRDRSNTVLPSDRVAVALRSGPVKQWKDMTPSERQRVMEQLRPPGVRP